MRNHTSESGFTLIELLIVIAIILILAAIAIPNYLHARMAANAASAVSSCREIVTQEETFYNYYLQGYSTTLAQLGPPASGTSSITNADLIDSVLASGQKSGYSFVYAPDNSNGTIYEGFQLNANPITPNITGTEYYFVDDSGVIRLSASTPATVASTALN